MADYFVSFNYMMDDEDPKRSGEIISDPEPESQLARARFGLNSAWHPDLVEAGFFTFNANCTPKIPNDEALRLAAVAYRLPTRVGGKRVGGEWTEISGDLIRSQDVANKFLSIAVNSGAENATKIIQRAINKVLFTLPGELGLHVDGVCGSQTLEALNRCDPVALMPVIKDYGCQYMRDCAPKLGWSPRELAAHLNRVNR